MVLLLSCPEPATSCSGRLACFWLPAADGTSTRTEEAHASTAEELDTTRGRGARERHGGVRSHGTWGRPRGMAPQLLGFSGQLLGLGRARAACGSRNAHCGRAACRDAAGLVDRRGGVQRGARLRA